ncbi:Protein NEP-17 a [Aphelenchoides avenae]|nr:Protein NEP-17 a [Aphelenchus avenae]
MGKKASAAPVCLGVLVLVVSLGILGVGIATVLKVYQKPADNTIKEGSGNNNSALTLNIPQPQPIQPGNQAKFNAYQNVVKYFNYSVKTSANPCNDFYGYVCGNYNKEEGFGLNDASNINRIAAKLEDMVGTNPASTALQKLMTFYTTCKRDSPTDAHGKLVNDGKLITAKVNKFAAESGLAFTWGTKGSTPITDLPNAKTLATALAYLSTAEGIDTLVSQMTDVDYALPTTKGDGPKGYRFYVDQNSLMYPKSYYAPGTFKQYRKEIEANIIQIFTLYGKAAGYTPDTATIQVFTEKIINLELALANSTYSVDDNTRRDYTRFRRAETTASDATAKYTFIDWAQYLTEGLKQTNLPDLIKDTSAYKFYVMEPEVIKTLSDNLVKKVPGFEPDTIVNYLFFRLVQANTELLPAVSKTTFHKIVKPSRFAIGRRRRGPGRNVFQHERDPFEPRFISADVDYASVDCASTGQDFMKFALARVFTDVKYPTTDAKAKIKRQVTR